MGTLLPVLFVCAPVAGVSRRQRPRVSQCLAVSTATTLSHSLHSGLEVWRKLEAHARAPRPHLRQLMADEQRCESLFCEHNRVLMDFSRQLVTAETMELLFELAHKLNLSASKADLFSLKPINTSEGRAVLHTALRAQPYDAVPDLETSNEVLSVLDQIRAFSEEVREGQRLGSTGQPLVDVVAIGIGGSFLGPAAVHTALETFPPAQVAASGRRLRFLANIDPEDVSRALSGLKAETTLVIVISKTFTTAETMLNARTVREWLVTQLGPDCIGRHMVACSTATRLAVDFGIQEDNIFPFWDWVGGRFSVSSAVGALPLSLQYGFDMFEEFLGGMRDMDRHFLEAPVEQNLPCIAGLLAVWNSTFLGLPGNAILPYCQALAKLAPHIQQLSMESNGKRVSVDGIPLDFATGEIIFGEPGTNGQHSFYQLIHQGRVVPCDFIGLVKSQQSIYLPGEEVSNHDELMSNFFAQADALALGKTEVELQEEGCPESLIPHKVFDGNRPSVSILLPSLGPFEIGQIIAFYEHRIAVQGFLWGINSFDQWGVELGKVLARRMRGEMSRVRRDRGDPSRISGFNYSTRRLLHRYYEFCEEQGRLHYADAFKSPFDEFIPCVGSDCAIEE
eukprot:CAMPEP_0184683010 /NCGR_PEP_ID=MMETSP0312-20130426/9590_1 /TAXON_ID=31354 /ORGANISM="Compsopogon coeruleus, Strain SAG 36.94" /LENGTH=620 /DNA_ID=CAMNT_0027135039 /DNA_START=110 /DNA_END=1972 /DNA_ORIENTATION=+